MADDTVERLHDALGATYEGWELLIEAADEIERLRAALQLVVDMLEEDFPKTAQQCAMDALGNHLQQAPIYRVPAVADDIVEQLRKIASRGRMDDADVQVVFDAADEIEQLREAGITK